MARKPLAADRTCDLLAPKAQEIEVPEDDVKGERVGHHEDADRLRENAFRCQAWTTKAFGIPDEPGNQYRLTHRGEFYYLETVSNSRYVGTMIPEKDLIAVATVFVGAARARTGKK